jgi:proton-dependent oligopeptide transporter, POT family
MDSWYITHIHSTRCTQQEFLLLPPGSSLAMTPTSEPTARRESLLRTLFRETLQPFVEMANGPRALWGINVSYLLEGLTYFGALALLAIYFNTYIGLNDIDAARMVGVLTAGITLSMLLLGATVDMVGPRRALLLSLSAMLIGRICLAFGPSILNGQGLWSPTHLLAMFGIFWIIIGYGIYQPACYAAVRYFTTEKTAAMGYAMLYGLMNLGGFLPGLISPPVRKATSILGVMWIYVGFTVVGIIVVLFMLTRKSVAAAMNESYRKTNDPAAERKPVMEQIRYYLRHFPIRDYRFMFFIFMLIPVQTLFAHNWLTLPQYCNRAFNGMVSDNFEFFSNAQSLLIFVLTPLVAAISTRANTYTMMIVGTFVMASPTFLLALGPNIYTLTAYLFIMTIGEAIWSPRFLQWVAEIAPKEMTGIYMGIGQFPWFLTKVITSLYSGWFLMQYCPQGVLPSQTHTETMWFIYGLIAMMTPIGLVLARGWMIKGFKLRHGE